MSAPYENTTIGAHTGPWTFEQALTCMKGGGKVRRKGWPHGVYWAISHGQLMAFDKWGAIPHFLSPPDLLANDWEPVS